MPFAVAAVIVYILFSMAAGLFLLEGALHAPRFLLTSRSDFLSVVDDRLASSLETVSIDAEDRARLEGWYAQPVGWNHDTVLLVHGVGDNREGVASYAKTFLKAGYAVLLPDSRGQGSSGGELVTYGLLESDDMRRWAAWATAREQRDIHDASGCIDLFGESMGAAIVLQATAAIPNACTVVAEAPFANFREIGYDRIAQRLGTSTGFARTVGWLTSQIAFAYGRARYHFDFNQCSPEHALAQSRVPALLIGDLADSNIPPRHVRMVFEVTRSRSELWLVPGAEHTDAVRVAPAEFHQRVLAWFSAHHR